MKTDELREAYLSFFESKGCVRKPSDLLVPTDDKSVLFTPAGMNQFKREFMGLGDPSFKRATTCQKCLRTGDIENVGRTAFHATFFEMLGNFSFGDYFKREAIHWAWEFLTKTIALPPERLSVTVYLTDDEAYDIWHKEIGLSPGRIERKDEDENFWPASAPSQGPNGVCGPCSEIYYHAEGRKEVEIWNLVFTQYNRVGPDQLEPLPSKNIDTGMGLERAVSCLQGVSTMFDNDVFKPIVGRVADVLGMTYQADSPDGIRLRRMSDHARTLTFAIHENIKPDPEKQGYVLRRLLRRAVLDAYQMGRREPFLFELIPTVAEVMKVPYPEVAGSVPRIRTVVREEEAQFLTILERGLSLIEDLIRKTKAAGSTTIDGRDTFNLQQTYGVPLEATASVVLEQGLTVDQEGFDQAQAEHQGISRPKKGTVVVFETGPLDELSKAHPGGTEFLGYQTTSDSGRILGILGKDQLMDSVGPEGGLVRLVLDRTPFYAESGGQIGDTGVVRGESFVFRVEDTQKKNDFILHLGHVEQGQVKSGTPVVAEVDAHRRQAIRRAHSATHVLHHALHTHLGEHAQQAGSKVEPDRLRFDFANPEAVGAERLRKVEDSVNALALKGDAITWSRMPLEEAKKLGAMALFGEKYPEIVRVVRMGEFSRELCGGTHLDNVGQIGLFKIVGEESVSAGTRRISALTGLAALEHIRKQEDTLGSIANALKTPPAQAAERVVGLLDEMKALKKQAAQRKADGDGRVSPEQMLSEAERVGDVAVIARALDGASMDDLRQLCDVLRRKAGERLAVLLASATDGKVSLVAALTEDLVKRKLHAGNWLKAVAPIVGGGGGGRPDLAQAGGKDPSRIAEALKVGVEAVKAQSP